ncbi:MAG: outer membrane protein transport protein [Bdellovibrionaceae bacterium]|nr:outer membrane protein transport protein [Pseudobdellovibrionaceae bacterium]
MNKVLLLILFFFSLTSAASYSNYNTILIGERAAGMGGAYTALSGDPAASSFYNPASLARMEGTSLSAAVSVYNKYETNFGEATNFAGAPLRVNQGSFQPVPTSSGSVYTFRNFAIGLSIVIPDSQSFDGEVKSENGNVSLLRLEDESLWVGGNIALNLSEKTALGLTMYYTARNFARAITDRIENGGNTSIYNEEKTLTNNSLIYILGLYQQLDSHWTLGLSHRFSSIEISGHGTYFFSEVSTLGASDSVNLDGILSDTKIPSKTTLGIAFEQKGHLTLSADLSYYGQEKYVDLQHTSADLIEHNSIWNLNLGGEYFYTSWLGLRGGIYSNFSSSPKIPATVSSRQPDYIDMWGFSANAAIYTSSQSSITLGGYWVGGRGHSTQRVSGNIERVPLSMQTFTLLVGTTFRL